MHNFLDAASTWEDAYSHGLMSDNPAFCTGQSHFLTGQGGLLTLVGRLIFWARSYAYWAGSWLVPQGPRLEPKVQAECNGSGFRIQDLGLVAEDSGFRV